MAGVGLLVASTHPAVASHEPGESLHCGSEQFVMRPNSGNWGIRKVEGTNTKFVVVSYEVTAQVDGTAGPTYGPFAYLKGNGNAHTNQTTETCTFTERADGITDPFTGEIVDVDFTIELTVIRKP
jgi:hypothetical protein